MEELAAIAERNGGKCYIEDGFTVRRLAYGSVFWPGPFELSDVDLDEVCLNYIFVQLCNDRISKLKYWLRDFLLFFY